MKMDEYIEGLKQGLAATGGEYGGVYGDNYATTILALAACEQAKQLKRVADWLESITPESPIPIYAIGKSGVKP